MCVRITQYWHRGSSVAAADQPDAEEVRLTQVGQAYLTQIDGMRLTKKGEDKQSARAAALPREGRAGQGSVVQTRACRCTRSIWPWVSVF